MVLEQKNSLLTNYNQESGKTIKMKKFAVFVLFLMLFINLSAQDRVGIFFSQNYSTFRFVDSENNKSDLDFTIKYGYGISFQHLLNDNLFFEGFLSYNNKGATSANDVDKLDWSFHYVNLSADCGYKFHMGRLQPQGGIGLYYGRLLKADQMIGSSYYNLLETSSLNNNDIGFSLFAGLDYEFSPEGVVFLRLNEAMGLLQLENSSTSDQEMFNRTFTLNLGLLFSIKK